MADKYKDTVTRTFSIGAICSGTKVSDDFYAARRHSSAGIRALLWATGSAKSFGCSVGSESQTSRENIFPNILTPDSIPQFTIPSLSVQNSLRSLDKETEEDDEESEEDLQISGTQQGSFVSVSPGSSTHSSSSFNLTLSDRRAERSVSDPLMQRRSLLQREGSNSSNHPCSYPEAQHCLDPASRAALSLPHLTKVTTPYGFVTLSQSPQMASEEALLCQAGLRRVTKDDETAFCLKKAPAMRTEDITSNCSHLSVAKKRLSKDLTNSQIKGRILKSDIKASSVSSTNATSPPAPAARHSDGKLKLRFYELIRKHFTSCHKE